MKQQHTLWAKYRNVLLLIFTFTILLIIYTPTLLKHISGGGNAYMDDVGEIQVALNVWGTIHHTGYPLFTILGNIFTTIANAIGTYPALSAVLYSMMWGLVALGVFYLLVSRLTKNAYIAAGSTLLLGLTRSIWIHNVIAEVYSMSLAFQVMLLAVALWPGWTSTRRQVWLLALIGGLGVAHHRLVILMAPGLLLAILPGLIREHRTGKNALVTLAVALLLGLIGFIPYLYLPARAMAGADWVYGHPGTFAGFWHEFTGEEAAFLMQFPANSQAFTKDIIDSFGILVIELTPIFALIGFVSFIAVMVNRRYRREGQIALVCAFGYLFFLFVLHRVVMPEAVAMPIVMVMVLALALTTASAIPVIEQRFPIFRKFDVLTGFVGVFVLGLAVTVMVLSHREFIQTMTDNMTGVKIIELAKLVPHNDDHAIMMLPWGPRYTAVAFSKLVTGQNAALRITDHKANFADMLKAGNVIYTPADTFYGPPFNSDPFAVWGVPVHFSGGGEGLIAVRANPILDGVDNPIAQVTDGIVISNIEVCQSEDQIKVKVIWGAEHKPQVSLSVLVHLLNADSDVPLTQADSSTPVYGWYPTTLWSAGELVEDDYVLPRLPGGSRVRIGMYEQKDGKFINYGLTTIPLDSAKFCNLSTTKN